MIHLHVMVGSQASPALPEVRKIGLSDLKTALAKGIDDFWAFPTHVIFLSIIYPIFGLLLACVTASYNFLPLLFPLVAGFALVGPFAATGLYELSRRRELGLDVSWKDALGARQSPSIDGILALGALLMTIFLLWIAVAEAIYIANFGYSPVESIPTFLKDVLTTGPGWNLIVIGNAVGFLFAVVVLSISVISFPLLLDRDVGAVVALTTSVRAVVKNPLPMAAWGLIVAALLLLGSLPLFFGLAVVMPVLGHSTWHLYREVVAPDPGGAWRREAGEEGRAPAQVHYAAQFPAALFAGERPRQEQDRQ
jgi:uncharacterized membrane protein